MLLSLVRKTAIILIYDYKSKQKIGTGSKFNNNIIVWKLNPDLKMEFIELLLFAIIINGYRHSINDGAQCQQDPQIVGK